jgi:hypothetical protein
MRVQAEFYTACLRRQGLLGIGVRHREQYLVYMPARLQDSGHFRQVPPPREDHFTIQGWL